MTPWTPIILWMGVLILNITRHNSLNWRNMAQLKRIGSYRSSNIVLEYDDGIKVYCYPDRYRNGVCQQVRGGEMTSIEITQDLTSIREIGHPFLYKGLRLRPCIEEEKAFFDGERRKAQLARLDPGNHPATVIGIKKKEYKQMPGGKFLIVTMLPNTKGSYQFSKTVWDVAKPGTKVIALVGLGKQHGQQVFLVGSKLYTRASRHVVQGRPRHTFTKYYKRHPSPWQHGSCRMALIPFKGEYFKYTM